MEPEVDEELLAVAKYFGKELMELSMENLKKLEERPAKGEEEEDDQESCRPSLESILGPMPTAASLGLTENMDCAGEETGKRWSAVIISALKHDDQVL